MQTRKMDIVLGIKKPTNSSEIYNNVQSMISHNQEIISELNFNLDQNQDTIYNYSLKMDMYQTEVNALSVSPTAPLNFENERDMKTSLNDRIEIIENIAKFNNDKELGLKDTLKELTIQNLI